MWLETAIRVGTLKVLLHALPGYEDLTLKARVLKIWPTTSTLDCLGEGDVHISVGAQVSGNRLGHNFHCGLRQTGR